MSRNKPKVLEPFDCPVCDSGIVAPACVPYEVEFRERRITVADAEVMRCGSCGEVFLAPGQSDALQGRAADAARSAMGLLPGSEIAEFRKQQGLTQAQLERAMGVPPKTVARWEIGSVLQSKAADRFLRVLMAHPALVPELLDPEHPSAPIAEARVRLAPRNNQR